MPSSPGEFASAYRCTIYDARPKSCAEYPRLLTLPLGELEVKKGKPNRQLVEAYCYWFWNYR